MKAVQRAIKNELLDSLEPNKVVVLIGARRVGKTVLIKEISEELSEKVLLLNGEDITVQQALASRSLQNYQALFADNEFLIIDEAQAIPSIGEILKLIVDELPGIKVLITGSSALDINNMVGEPLTGRKKTLRIFPLSELELDQVENRFEKLEGLRHRLVYGNYPELLQLKTLKEKQQYLQEVISSYLLKDILAFDSIRNSDKILDLLRLIAYQVGHEVSYQELGQKLSMSKNTVERYLDLLTKVFVVHKLQGFSRNLRNEVTKNHKWYFYDNGIRNALIANLNSLEMRNDVGQLWENYIINERIKQQHYNQWLVNNYFWRTYDQQEIDWVEDRGGELHGYEFKYSPKKTKKAPAKWSKAYPNAYFEVVSGDGYYDWLS